MEKKIKATFIGQEGSCGYKNGLEYDLILKQDYGTNIIISRDGETDGLCAYDTMIGFTDNWTNISNHNETHGNFNHESQFMDSLLEAASWEETLTNFDKKSLSYNECKTFIINKVFRRYKFLISK